jgi:hypothetical protein
MSQAATSDHHGDYHRGDMDIREHVATFKFFNTMTKWGSLVVAALILMFTLAFCTSAGFGTGFVAAVVLLALGIFFLRSKPTSGH